MADITIVQSAPPRGLVNIAHLVYALHALSLLIGVTTAAMSLDEAVDKVQAMHDAAKKVNPDVIVLCHGGPISMPDDAAYVLRRAQRVHGFYGASSMERLPTERALRLQTEAFKAITF